MPDEDERELFREAAGLLTEIENLLGKAVSRLSEVSAEADFEADRDVFFDRFETLFLRQGGVA